MGLEDAKRWDHTAAPSASRPYPLAVVLLAAVAHDSWLDVAARWASIEAAKLSCLLYRGLAAASQVAPGAEPLRAEALRTTSARPLALPDVTRSPLTGSSPSRNARFLGPAPSSALPHGAGRSRPDVTLARRVAPPPPRPPAPPPRLGRREAGKRASAGLGGSRQRRRDDARRA